MQNLKTGNPIFDMLISAMILSFFGYLFSNLSDQKSNFVSWLKKKLLRRPRSELTFLGEEFHDNWGTIAEAITLRLTVQAMFTEDSLRPSGLSSTTLTQQGLAPSMLTKRLQQRVTGAGTAIKKHQEVAQSYAADLLAQISFNQTYMPNVDDSFELAPGILCERTVQEEVEPSNSKKDSNRSKSRVLKIRVFSYTKPVEELKAFIAGLIKAFQKYMKEEVDQTQNYFITKIEKIEETPTLLYDQFEFVSTRTFKNIFFEQKEELVRRLDFFLNNQKWYEQRGVPYTLGFMFYGPPGTGKTSTIKAIATYTKRHIVEISLSRIKTYKDLQKVFNDTNFCDKTIPHHKMIYILEDIDCLDNIVKARDLKSDERDEPEKKKKKENESESEEDPIAKGLDAAMKLEYEYFKAQMKSWNKDPLTLSHILNIIDGLLECHGRILVITTNQPEKLDSALIRPGRVDMKVHFDWATIEDTIAIVEMFYDTKVPQQYLSQIINKKFTAAEVYQICFQSLNIDATLQQLVKKDVPSLSESQALSRQDSNPSLRQSSKKKRSYLDGSNVTLQFVHK